mmetsp:Transcript_14155/g.30755  ORF Transcript_14155/g.30755 Transcript_14155/m.30755 type:complete len:138 (+) Transcript_14155:1379-1792(+)
MYVKCDHISSANYEAGARIHEIQEDKSIKEVAFFQTNDCYDIINMSIHLQAHGHTILTLIHLPPSQAMVTMVCLSSMSGSIQRKMKGEQNNKRKRELNWRKKNEKGGYYLYEWAFFFEVEVTVIFNLKASLHCRVIV